MYKIMNFKKEMLLEQIVEITNKLKEIFEMNFI